MLIKREILEDELLLLLEEFNTNHEIRNYIVDKLAEKGVFKTDVEAIFDKTLEIRTLDRSVLYLLCKAFYDKIERSIINPEKIFAKTEIQEYKGYDFTIKEDDIFPIVLEDVGVMAEDHYTTVIDIKPIVKWYSNRIVKYNPKTQRPRILKEVHGKTIEVNDINSKRVGEMAERIDKKLQFPNHIIINLVENGDEYLEYKKDERKLIIYQGEMNIVDGANRSMAFLEAVSKNPDIFYNTGLTLTHFTEEKALDFMRQEELKEPMSKIFTESINQDRLVNKIVNKLNESGDLRGLITTNMDYINKYKALTLTNVIADTIEYHYEIKSQKDIYDISKWLIKFFGYVVGYNPEAFKPNLDIKKFKKIKSNSYINYKDIFVGYIALSKHFYNKDNWVDKLYDTFNNIDFSKQNKDWGEINLVNSSLKKSFIKNVSNYFIKKVVE